MKTKLMKNPVQRPFGARDKVGYMMGDFGCNMSFQLISNYLLLFATQGLGLSMVHWSIIIIISKIFDAINDPIIGAIVDSRKSGRFGKYIPWIFFGAFAIALTTTLLFIDIRGVSEWGKFAYILIMYCIWSIAYTAANVPYGSLNAALTDDPSQRSSLSALRSIGAGVAVLPVIAIVPKLIYGDRDPVTGNEVLKPEVFVWIALVFGIIGIVGFMLTCFLTKERKQVVKSKEKFNYVQTLKGFVKNRGALGMCLASFSQLVFVMSYGITLPLICQFYFKDASNSGMVSIVMMAPMMFFIPFMGKLTKRFGKKEISMWPNIVAIAILIVMLFIPFPATSAGMWGYAALLGVAMLASAPLNLGTWSMVADCVDEQEVKTSKKDGKNMYATYLKGDEFGKRDEASVYATYSLARKAAQGIGSAIVSALLAAPFIGYDSTKASETTMDTASRMLKLSIVLPLVGTILIFVAFLFVYNLSKKKVIDNTEFLRAKNERLAIQQAHGAQEDDGQDIAEVISFDEVVEVQDDAVASDELAPVDETVADEEKSE